MWTWLAGKGAAGFSRLAWIVFIGVLVAIAIVVADNAFEDVIDTSREAGAADAVAAGQETTLDQIGDATDAGNEIRNDTGDRKYRQCMRDSAPGYESSCERYRPVEPVPGRPAAADPGGAGGGP